MTQLVGLGSAGVKFINSPSSIYQLLFAGIEGVAVRAYFDGYSRYSGARSKAIAAAIALNLGFDVFGVKIGLHNADQYIRSDRRGSRMLVAAGAVYLLN